MLFNYKFKDIILGYYVIYAIDENDNLYGAGLSDYGALSIEGHNGYELRTLTPSLVNKTEVKQIISPIDGENTLILKNDGTVYCYGKYDYLETIDNIKDDIIINEQLNIYNVKKIATYCNNYLFLKNDDTLWGCGENNNGQLGLGHLDRVYSFTQVPNMNNIKDMHVGNCHAIILKNDGTLWGTGLKDRVGLGPSDWNDYATSFAQLTDSNGNIITNVDKIIGAAFATIVIKTTGEILAVGPGNFGDYGTSTFYDYFTQIGTMSSLNVKEIIPSFRAYFILKNDGTVWASGANYGKKFGVGDSVSNYYKFTQIATDVKKVYTSTYGTILVKTNGDLYGAGYIEDGRLLGYREEDVSNATTFKYLNLNMDNDNIEDIIMNPYHTFLIKKNEDIIYTCGSNNDYKTGLIMTTPNPNFIFITDNVKAIKYNNADLEQLAVLKNDGTLLVSGFNSYGQLGFGHKNVVYKLTKLADDVKDFWISEFNTLFLKNDDSLWSCGDNIGGCAGIPTAGTLYTPTKIMDNANIKKLYPSLYYTESTRLLKNDGTAWSCGDNYTGALGLDHNNLQYGFKQMTVTDIKDMVCSQDRTFAIKNDNTLWACGRSWGDEGNALGLGSTIEANAFTQVPNIDNVKKVIANNDTTLVIKNDGTIWGCGENDDGELTFDSSTNPTEFTQLNITKNVKDIITSDPSEYTYNYIFVCDDGLYFTGWNTIGFLRDKSTLYQNFFELTLIDGSENIDISKIKKIEILYEKMAVLMEDGSTYFCGDCTYYNGGFQLNLIGNMVKRIYGFEKHKENQDSNNQYYITINGTTHLVTNTEFNDSFEMITTHDNKIFVRGSNDNGQLGMPGVEDINNYTELNIPNINIKNNTCGDTHSLLLDEQNILYGTGSNKHGQLLNLPDGINEFTQLETDVKYARATKNLTIIKKNNIIYVAGETIGNEFVPYTDFNHNK